jgi:hypothetical protein
MPKKERVSQKHGLKDQRTLALIVATSIEPFPPGVDSRIFLLEPEAILRALDRRREPQEKGKEF